MTSHPGRYALLWRAAIAPDVTPTQRAELVRLALRNTPTETALTALKNIADHHHQGQHAEVNRALHQLIADDQETTDA